MVRQAARVAVLAQLVELPLQAAEVARVCFPAQVAQQEQAAQRVVRQAARVVVLVQLVELPLQAAEVLGSLLSQQFGSCPRPQYQDYRGGLKVAEDPHLIVCHQQSAVPSRRVFAAESRKLPLRRWMSLRGN